MTVEEARSAALEELVPKAVNVLREHLESGHADAWRSAHKVLEHAWGRVPERVTVDTDADLPPPIDVASMSDKEFEMYERRLLTRFPELEG